jgi:hypothetical protein
VIVITATADENASVSFGLTWLRSFPNNRVNASPAVAPQRTPTAVNLKPREMTRRKKIGCTGAKSHAQPEFAVGLRHGIRHHAIQADGSEEKRQSS